MMMMMLLLMLFAELYDIILYFTVSLMFFHMFTYTQLFDSNCNFWWLQGSQADVIVGDQQWAFLFCLAVRIPMDLSLSLSSSFLFVARVEWARVAYDIYMLVYSEYRTHNRCYCCRSDLSTKSVYTALNLSFSLLCSAPRASQLVTNMMMVRHRRKHMPRRFPSYSFIRDSSHILSRLTQHSFEYITFSIFPVSLSLSMSFFSQDCWYLSRNAPRIHISKYEYAILWYTHMDMHIMHIMMHFVLDIRLSAEMTTRSGRHRMHFINLLLFCALPL